MPNLLEEVLGLGQEAQSTENPELGQLALQLLGATRPEMGMVYGPSARGPSPQQARPTLFDRRLYGQEGIQYSPEGDVTMTPRPAAQRPPVETLRQLLALSQIVGKMPSDVQAQLYKRFTGLDVPTTKEKAQFQHELGAPERAATREALAQQRAESLDLRKANLMRALSEIKSRVMSNKLARASALASNIDRFTRTQAELERSVVDEKTGQRIPNPVHLRYNEYLAKLDKAFEQIMSDLAAGGGEQEGGGEEGQPSEQTGELPISGVRVRRIRK